MRIVKAGAVDPISLGKKGEKNAVQVEFDLSGFIRDYGDGSAQLTVRRPGDNKEYAAALERRGDTAVWTIGPEWTATDGQGKCELNWFVGEDTVAKDQRIWRTAVQDSLGEGTDTPTAPEQALLTQVQAQAAKAEQAAKKAEDVVKGAEGAYYTPRVTQPSADTMKMSFTPSKSGMESVAPVTVHLPAGPAGADGKDGAPGKDGSDGAQGPAGKDGTNGKDGSDGYTPKRGVDYYTEADKAEMVAAVVAALPVYNGEVEDL